MRAHTHNGSFSQICLCYIHSSLVNKCWRKTMQFLKLGSKQDFFYCDGDVNIAVDSELPSDVVFVVEGKRFHLHKYPLLTKCGYLQSLATQKNINNEINIEDIPGGYKSFELCAKFCYGIVITLHAFNVMAVRCASEYLQMTESLEKGNLGYKIEMFLNSIVFQSWKDCMISLQCTKSLQPWAEDLNLVNGCINSITFKACMDLSTSPSNNTNDSVFDDSTSHWNDMQVIENHGDSKDWWMEDVCELDIDLFQRVLLAFKSTGRVTPELVGKSLIIYAYRWLPGLSRNQNLMETIQRGIQGGCDDSLETLTKHKLLLETIVGLLPAEKGSTSCSFLLKLLKAANLLLVTPSTKMELVRRIGMQLEEASLNDLFIPSLSYASDSLYDVELVQCIVEHYVMHLNSPLSPYNRRMTPSGEHFDLFDKESSKCAMHGSELRVAKLIDGYLAEIARDSNLVLETFIALAELIPDSARPMHDDLYGAIDIYLKEHPGMTKNEKKKLCRLMDCKKLSINACMHAAQNDRLPLRVVVQVLFFQQARIAMTGRGYNSMNNHHNLPANNIMALMPPPHVLHCNHDDDDDDDDDDERSLEPSRTSIEKDWQKDFRTLKADMDLTKNSSTRVEGTRNHAHMYKLKPSRTRHLFFYPKKVLRKIWASVSQTSASKVGIMMSSEMSSGSSVGSSHSVASNE